MIPYRIQQAAKQVRRHLQVTRGMLHIDSHDLAGTVLLAGSGRSGTTWMSQIINHGNPYRDLFEPLHPQHVRQVQGWPAMRYLPTKQGDCDEALILRALLTGRIRSRWTDQYNRKHLVKRRVIKAIRTNLMLGYLRESFPPIKLLFAMRHPCAVAHSRIKLRWDTHLNELLAQRALMHDHLEPYREKIERIEYGEDHWAKHLAMWCIENVVPLRELSAGDAHLLRYEDLCDDFNNEVAGLFANLGRPIPAGIYDVAQHRSAHFRRDSAILHGGNLVADWQQHVEPKQIDAMLDMLQVFGLSHLYDENPLPSCARDVVFHTQGNALSKHSLLKEAA